MVAVDDKPATVRKRQNERDPKSYQESLRKLGAWLDISYAYNVVLQETEHGFRVRYYRQDIDSIFIQRFFPHSELEGLRPSDLRLRRTWVRRVGRRIQGIAGEPGGYQNLFRALGYRLDQDRARRIRLVENDEDNELLLSYESPDITRDSDGEQPVMHLRAQERDEMRASARDRRRRSGLLSLLVR